MKVFVGKFAEKCLILFFAPVRIIKLMCCVEVYLAGNVNGFFTIVHPSKNRAANIDTDIVFLFFMLIYIEYLSPIKRIFVSKIRQI